MTWTSVAALGVVLAGAPALPGIATRTKSFLTGRRGPPALQLYAELAKLVRKRAVYSGVTTWVFRAGPVAGVVTALLAALLLPLDGRTALAQFPADFLLFAGALALGRFAFILAALDTGSSFEGMGASREAMVGAFAEAALFLALGALTLATGAVSLTDMLGTALTEIWHRDLPALVILGVSLFVLLLAETSRVPVDDPATHLELTMLHEVAVLDHGGPDLALVLYGGALRFALFAALIAGVLAPRGALATVPALLLLAASLAALAAAVGVVEALMARLRMNRVPQLLAAAAALAAFATILLLRRP